MYELKTQLYFSAAHHLLNYEGECENQHGHNWLTEVYAAGTELDKSNILIDYKVLKTALKSVLESLDHKDINTLDEFKNVSPSSEVLAKYIYTKMKNIIPQTSKVSVWETPVSCASYYETEE